MFGYCVWKQTKRSDVKTIQRRFCSDKTEADVAKSQTEDWQKCQWQMMSLLLMNDEKRKMSQTTLPPLPSDTSRQHAKDCTSLLTKASIFRKRHREMLVLWQQRWRPTREDRKEEQQRRKVEQCRLWHSRNEWQYKGFNGVSCKAIKVKKWEWQEDNGN